MTAILRKSPFHLFLAVVKPHNPVAPCTIAYRLKEALKMSGINISIFTVHSTRVYFHQQLHTQELLPVTSSKQLTRALNQYSESFTTGLLTTLHTAQMCCHQQVVRLNAVD